MADDVTPQAGERIDALAGRWRERAARTARTGTLPAETLEELFDAGLLQLAAAERYGGLGAAWPVLADAARRAARACPSTGWTVGVVGAHAGVASRFPDAAAGALFADGPRQLFATASVTANGVVERVEGGFRIDGEWRFCSGIDHASWVIVNGACANAPEEGRLLLPVPADRVRVSDTWHVTGMSGTGSRSAVLDDVLVPEKSVAPLGACFGERWTGRAGEDGYLLEVPFTDYVNSVVIGPILGCAEGAYREYAASARASGRADQPAVQMGLAESAAELACAGHLYDAVAATLHAAGTERRALSPKEAGTVRRDRAYLARLCVDAVQRLVALAGTAAHSEDAVLSRHWRDLQMMAAHRDVSWAANYPAFAAVDA
ncbi:acyl-CoA dehydrogenase family protein [Actinorugispora endophytica]|uniref:3-hydroxy-9,10-secoandrosta-1,3,5(10)-triene-9, 17-dione monooxygenase n=1 Tax=Actinorugispora endophytica TaxID=1605990 RepID=A0A4R6V0L1_9ACTN|nr:acyl-CoA dehydrogenase family protein [Actinorugispora endophytica]TDQ53283.1 3-hydroxy-9,10-secoandrosta-1,3,5(10)-triene-9,17-dione monooxygenase [Actinorugispora endophytica]